MPERPINVLFLSPRNPVRSMLAEATLNHIGNGRFRAFSTDCSARENQHPHPLALQVLQNAGIPPTGRRSRPRDEFGKTDPPPMDLVITLCDHADGEACPSGPSAPAFAHWRYPDPSTIPGGKQTKLWAFEETLQAMRKRLELLVMLTAEKSGPTQLQRAARSLSSQV